MEEKYSISSWIKACLVGFEMQGWDSALISKKAALDPDSLNGGYCSIETYNSIFAAAENLYGPSAGLVARKGVLPNTFHSFSLAMMSAGSVRESLSLVVKHNESICNVLDFFISEDEPAVFGFRLCKNVKLRPAVAIAVLASVLKTARFTRPGKTCIVQVEMAHPEPEHAGIFQSYFKVPIKWGMSRYALHYDISAFDAPSLFANQSMMLREEQSWVEEIASFEQVNFLVRLRSFIKANIGNPQLAIEFVAQVFGMSLRTFQRRLGIEGTSFKQLHDHARKVEALSLIEKDNAMTSEAADSLGFADVGSFSRAFKRWFGVSPEQFKKQQNTLPDL